MVNNAAINAMGDVELMSLEKYKEVADVNLYGMVRVTKAFAPLIRKYRGMISEDLHVTYITLVNVYVDLVVFTRIAGILKTGSGRYWC